MIGLLALAFCALPPEAGPIPVVLTTDCGVEVDDQWALAHLARSRRVDLRGVVTTHAPSLEKPAAHSSARAVRGFLEGLAPKPMPKVLPGSDIPLGPSRAARSNEGVDFLLRESRVERGGGGRLRVLVIGAATDVASALLVDPGFADRIEIIAMGFDGWPAGGDSWNVKNDVQAWQVLLESRAPLVVGDAAVCKTALSMSTEKAGRVLKGCGATGQTLVDLLRSWVLSHRELVERVAAPGEWPIWDEVTTAHLLGLTEVEVLPRPRLREDLSLDHSAARGTLSWIRSVRSDALWTDLGDCLRQRP
ncbi:MAG: hypothetical protein NVSMB9_33140 [Isosphaeraceae bacterium]